MAQATDVFHRLHAHVSAPPRRTRPPHTRSMFMCALAVLRMRCSRWASLIRVGKESAGIQLAPLAKMGTPYGRSAERSGEIGKASRYSQFL